MTKHKRNKIVQHSKITLKKSKSKYAKIKPIVILILIIILSIAFYYTDTKPNLSELQIEACNSADTSGTCESRLPELGIVLYEECCKALKKCC